MTRTVWHLMPLGQRGAAGASLEDVVGSGAKLLAPTLQLCATVRRFGEGGSLWPRTGNRALVGCGGEPGWATLAASAFWWSLYCDRK